MCQRDVVVEERASKSGKFPVLDLDVLVRLFPSRVSRSKTYFTDGRLLKPIIALLLPNLFRDSVGMDDEIFN